MTKTPSTNKKPSKTKTKANATKKTGRPTLYSEELADKIVALIEEGFSERKISKMNGMPSLQTLSTWKDKYEGFLERSIRARRISAERYEDEREDTVEQVRQYVENTIIEQKVVDPGVIRGFDLIMRELARSAANRDDSRFGDRKKVELTGKDGGAIQTESKVASMTTEELMRIAQMQTNEQGIDTGSKA